MKKKVIFIFCLTLISLFFLSTVSADVGNSFSGGSGSSSGGYGSSSGGFGLNGLFFFLSDSPLSLIILIVVFVALMYTKRNSGHSSTQNNNSSFKNVMIDEAAAVTSVQANDPNFSADKFKTFVSEVYIAVQEAWESRDFKAVRSFESNALYNTHVRQIQEYINQMKTPHLDMQNIRSITIASYRVDGNQEVMSVKLDASLLDFTTDDKSGKVLEGSTTQYQYRSYRLEFIRSLGVKTDITKDLMTTNCPNCGAPTTVTSSGECEYCHSVITNGEYGWVLNKYAAW